jgi:Flp pilus assembly pilin Flp
MFAEVGVLHKLLADKGFHNEEGQDMVEYALLLGFVALASVVILSTLSSDISLLWSSIANTLASTS